MRETNKPQECSGKIQVNSLEGQKTNSYSQIQDSQYLIDAGGKQSLPKG